MNHSFLLTSTLFISLLLLASTAWGFRARGGFRFGFGFKIGRGGKGGEAAVEGEVGDTCVPTSPLMCGERTLISGPDVEQLSEDEAGPNACRYTFMFEISMFEYELMRSERCVMLAELYGRDPADCCPLFCRSTGVCSAMQVPEEVIDCCEGFTTERPTPLQLINEEDVEFSGCPINTTCPEDPDTIEGGGLNK